jgi:DnaK suppressor protein
MPPISDGDLAQLRNKIDEREALLRSEVRAVEEEKSDIPRSVPMSHVEDQGERGEEETREAIRHAEQDRDALELRDIADARERMDRGTYGVCIDCDAEIPLARLRVQPAAARCMACQQRFEQWPRGSAPSIPRDFSRG